MACEQYASLFSQSISRRSTQNASVTFSGGRDSRHILFELVRQGIRPLEVIISHRPVNNDHLVAKAVADHIGVNVTDIGLCAFSWSEERKKNIQNHFLSDENVWYRAISQSLKASIVFDGLAGDVLSNGLYFDRDVAISMREGNFHNAAKKFISAFGQSASYLIHGESIERRAVERVAAEMSLHENAPNPVSSFVFHNRTRREIALMPICMLGEGVDASLPYLDADLYDFFMSLPFEEFGDQGFHDEVIRKAYPEQAHLPYAENTKRHVAREFPREALREWCVAVNTGLIRKIDLLKTILRLLTHWNASGLYWRWIRLLPLIQLQMHGMAESSTGRSEVADRLFRDLRTSEHTEISTV